uniref:Uncharacterized protein n=1 Tax=Hyaloperonospora arabidopsidis (strain Emoy2) TaxID=559515 RepID=M4B9Z4_HYAAE
MDAVTLSYTAGSCQGASLCSILTLWMNRRSWRRPIAHSFKLQWRSTELGKLTHVTKDVKRHQKGFFTASVLSSRQGMEEIMKLAEDEVTAYEKRR